MLLICLRYLLFPTVDQDPIDKNHYDYYLGEFDSIIIICLESNK